MSEEFEITSSGEVVLVHEEDGVLKKRDGSIAYVSGLFSFQRNVLNWPSCLPQNENELYEYFTDPVLLKIVSKEMDIDNRSQTKLHEYVKTRSGYDVGYIGLRINFIPKGSKYIVMSTGLQILGKTYEC